MILKPDRPASLAGWESMAPEPKTRQMFMAVGGDIREAAPAGAASRISPPTAILTGGSGDWAVDDATGRPVLPLDADYPPGAYKRLDDGHHVPDHA